MRPLKGWIDPLAFVDVDLADAEREGKTVRRPKRIQSCGTGFIRAGRRHWHLRSRS